MEAFAAATVIFLLVCVLALIGVVVFFKPNTTSNTTTTIIQPVQTQPGGSNAAKAPVRDGKIYGADVNYPLSSSRNYYDNRGDNNFWYNIYNEVSNQLNLDSTITSVSGSSTNYRTGSNAYIDPLLSRASGQTSNHFMDYDLNSHEMALYNPY